MKLLTATALLLAFLYGVAGAQTASQTATVTATWTINSTTEQGFNIERRTGSTGTFAKVGQVGPKIATFTDTIANDPGSTQYCYRVNAFNASGVSAYSNIACATTPIVAVPIPTAPSGVNVSVSVTVTVGP